MIKIKEYIYHSDLPERYQQYVEPRIQRTTFNKYTDYLVYLQDMKNRGILDYKAIRKLNEVTIRIWL